MVSDLNILLTNGLKLPRQFFFFLQIKKKLFTFEVPFKRLFTPLLKVGGQIFFPNPNPNFRDSESLRKSNGKKWSQIWTFLLKNGQKLPPRKKVKKNYLCSLHLNVFLPPLPEVQCPNFLDFPNPWGKNNGKNWFHIWIPLLIKGKKSPRKKKFDFPRILPY